MLTGPNLSTWELLTKTGWMIYFTVTPRQKLGGSRENIDSALQTLELRHKYFVELDQLFCSQEFGTAPTVENLKKLVGIVARHSRFHFPRNLFYFWRCDSAWYAFVTSAVVWFLEWLYFGEITEELEDRIQRISATCFHSWSSPSEKDVLTGSQLLRIDIINSLFQKHYGS